MLAGGIIHGVIKPCQCGVDSENQQASEDVTLANGLLNAGNKGWHGKAPKVPQRPKPGQTGHYALLTINRS
jgi:hypothetical protein